VGEVLSQSEIDILLSAMQSGTVDLDNIIEEEKKVRLYDFRRPNKFSKEQLNAIQVIYDSFCLLLTTLFSGILRTRVSAKVASIDQVTYEEFSCSMSSPTILSIYSLPPLEGKGLIEFNPAIGFSIIDRLFGGPGISTFKGRQLTEIEKNVFEKIMEKILSLFGESWSSLHTVTAIFEGIETNPQYNPIVASSEMVLVIVIDTKIGEVEGLINICLPCLMLEGIAEKLSKRFWFASSSSVNSEKYKGFLRRTVERTVIPVRAVLGSNTITVKDLIELQVGDVIPLEKKANSNVDVYVDSELKFYGKPGVLGNKMAIQITAVESEGGD